jgi:hypothetical protein
MKFCLTQGHNQLPLDYLSHALPNELMNRKKKFRRQNQPAPNPTAPAAAFTAVSLLEAVATSSFTGVSEGLLMLAICFSRLATLAFSVSSSSCSN